jgi:hypothetical protein
MSKEECAKYCDSVGCTAEEKAMCVSHAGKGKACCSGEGHGEKEEHKH